MILLLITLIVGFVIGILFERRNAKRVDRVLTEAEMLKEKGKALLDALKGR
jgi:uncharacterized membrane-anchored protein YhcB (DUF1043 family)